MSSIDECRISLNFTKIHIPCLEIKNCLIHLKYEDKQYRISYPQKAPFVMKYYHPFSKVKNTMVLTILVPTGKKYRRLGKGFLHIYKKYFYSNNLSFEKWIYLSLSSAQIQQMAFNTDILTTELNGGQIYLSATLLDPIPKGQTVTSKLFNEYVSNSYLRSKSKKISPEKEKVTSNKTEKFRSVVEGNNAFLKKLKSGKLSNNTSMNYYSELQEKEYKDDYSDVSMSDLSFDNCLNEYRIVPNINMKIEKIMIKTENILNKVDKWKANEHLTKDITKQRELYTSLNNGIKKISDEYIKCIKDINSMNSKIRTDAKAFYKEYTLEKEKFLNERKIMFNKNKKLENDIQENIKSNSVLVENIIKAKLDNQTLKVKYADRISNDNDINTMIDILNTFKFFNVDISKGLNKEDSENLTKILQRRNKILYNLTTNNTINNIANNKNLENFNVEEESEKIIDTIETIVNLNYNKKKIPRIKIEQIDCYTYLFDKLRVILYFDDYNVLKCENGKDFELWLLEHFEIK